jgi:hypothetical protein
MSEEIKGGEIVTQKKKNGIGTAGFILAIIGFVFCWLPIVNIIVWFLGFLFSLIGVFKKPKVLAFIGLGISLILLIVILVVFGAVLFASF